MWHKLVGILIIGMLLSLPVGQQPVQGQSTTAETRAHVNAQVAKILADGDATDEIPVIITLQSTEFARNSTTDASSRQQRISTVRAVQRDFVGRNASRIRASSRQPQLNSIVFAKMSRQDVAAVAADSAVIGIKQDKPMRVQMVESMIITGSAGANYDGYDGAGMTVAVLDTGVLTDHEFITGQVVAEACFSDQFGTETSLCPSGTSTTNTVSNDVGSAAPCVGYDGCDHGTHVAGTVAGNILDPDSISPRGVAPGAKIIAIQVFTYFDDSDPRDEVDDSGIGSYTADQILAMDWLMTNMSTPDWGTLAALNMSLGGGRSATTCDEDEVAMKEYIDDFRALGVATVIASGNDGWKDSISSPACISSAIAVGATTTSSAIGYEGHTAVDQVAYFSNAPTRANNRANSSGDRLLDLLAPGLFINSAVTTSTTAYYYKAGTSMATPHVAGAWALMRQAKPTASVSQILQWLYTSGTLITDRNSLVLPRFKVDEAIELSFSPIAFNKSNPAHNRINQPLTVTLSWAASRGATSYQYCLATSATSCTTWRSVGTARSVTVRNLVRNKAYYWNVRAVNSYGRTVANGSTWKFTTMNVPAAFNKSSPANNLTNRPLTLTLSWAASGGATSYEYCLANTAAACTNWKSVGTARSVTVRSLARNRAYFWNVRAKNTAGTTVANGGIWKFTTIR